MVKRVTGEPDSVVDALRMELRLMPASVRASALAMSALALARSVDSAGTSATARSMCARELRDHLDALRALAPPKVEKDAVADLAARRAARRKSAS